MNYTRILLGGALAGLTINLVETLTWAVLFAEPYRAMLRDHALTEARWAMAAYAGSSFGLGLVLAWLLAATRLRWRGLGGRLQVGLALWIAAWLVPAVWQAAMGLSLDVGTSAIRLTLALSGVLAAAMAAAAVYRDSPVNP